MSLSDDFDGSMPMVVANPTVDIEMDDDQEARRLAAATTIAMRDATLTVATTDFGRSYEPSARCEFCEILGKQVAYFRLAGLQMVCLLQVSERSMDDGDHQRQRCRYSSCF